MNLFEIGINLKKLRKEEGLSQEVLSKKVGISRVTLGKIERGELGVTSVKSLQSFFAKNNHDSFPYNFAL